MWAVRCCPYRAWQRSKIYGFDSLAKSQVHWIDLENIGIHERACGKLAGKRRQPPALARARPDSGHHERKKVDGSLTSCPGSKLNCKLSGTGQIADLYSDFGVQRISECLCSSKSYVVFSATGRGLRIAKYAAKCDKNGGSPVTSLAIMTCWRRGGDSIAVKLLNCSEISEIAARSLQYSNLLELTQ